MTEPPAVHRVPIAGGDWLVWRQVALRSTGLPVRHLVALGSTGATAAADRVLVTGPAEAEQAVTAYQRAFVLDLEAARAQLRASARLPRFREAVTWQNPAALEHGIDHLLASPAPAANRKTREREALITSYLQRFCAKNDCIGFFGPMGWAEIDDGEEAISSRPGEPWLGRRTVYFECWAIDALAETLAADERLRPWLRPRRWPHLDVDGLVVRAPNRPPFPVSEPEVALLRRCDGRSTVEELCRAAGQAGAVEVPELLRGLCERGLLSLGFELPLQAHPERALRRDLERIGEPDLRREALARLVELERARDAVSAAAGDADRLRRALGDLRVAFARQTGRSPSRLPGRHYAGRGLVYEDCVRNLDLRIGRGLMRRLGEPLSLVLQAARWFVAAVAARYLEALTALHEELGEGPSAEVELADLWFWSQSLFFGTEERPVDAARRELTRRWASVLAADPTARRRRYRTEDLRAPVASLFAAPGPAWPSARVHSPDVLLAAADEEAIRRGDFLLVLGELHVARNTINTACIIQQHDDPARLRRDIATDVRDRMVVPVLPKTWPRVTSRTRPGLAPPSSLRFSFGPDSGEEPPVRSEPITAFVVCRGGAGPHVRHRGTGERLGLLDVFSHLLGDVVAQAFALVPEAPHVPRIEIDGLVAQRETWRARAEELPFSLERDEAARFLGCRRWARGLELPRWVFLGSPAEPKPICIDLESIACVELLCRVVRRARASGTQQPLTVAEMLPGPEHAWLRDASGERYLSELRFVAVDGCASAGDGGHGRQQGPDLADQAPDVGGVEPVE